MEGTDWTAQLDQTLAATRDFAKAAASFYRGLIEDGVPPESAVLITNGYVSSIIVIGFMNAGEGLSE